MATKLTLSILAPLVLVLAVPACSASEGAAASDAEQQSSDLSATPWQAILACGGGLVIDVDAHERRHVQAVVRDRGAVAWLGAHPGGSRTSGVPNAHGEIVLDGFTQQRIFGAHEFHGFTRSAFSVADALLPEAYVTREGDGARVRLVTWASGHEVETANWLFHDCH
jgi:hypothetical protein